MKPLFAGTQRIVEDDVFCHTFLYCRFKAFACLLLYLKKKREKKKSKNKGIWKLTQNYIIRIDDEGSIEVEETRETNVSEILEGVEISNITVLY